MEHGSSGTFSSGQTQKDIHHPYGTVLPIFKHDSSRTYMCIAQ